MGWRGGLRGGWGGGGSGSTYVTIHALDAGESIA